VTVPIPATVVSNTTVAISTVALAPTVPGTVPALLTKLNVPTGLELVAISKFASNATAPHPGDAHKSRPARIRLRTRDKGSFPFMPEGRTQAGAKLRSGGFSITAPHFGVKVGETRAKPDNRFLTIQPEYASGVPSFTKREWP